MVELIPNHISYIHFWMILFNVKLSNLDNIFIAFMITESFIDGYMLTVSIENIIT